MTAEILPFNHTANGKGDRFEDRVGLITFLYLHFGECVDTDMFEDDKNLMHEVRMLATVAVLIARMPAETIDAIITETAPKGKDRHQHFRAILKCVAAYGPPGGSELSKTIESSIYDAAT